MVFDVTIDDRHLPGEGPDQGCLAGTVGSNDRPVLAGGDFPTGSREKASIPDPNRNPVQCDERLSVSVGFPHFFSVFLNGRSEKAVGPQRNRNNSGFTMGKPCLL
jgi:hypothetical protein